MQTLIKKIRGIPTLRRGLLLTFFLISLFQAPTDLSAHQASQKPLTIKLASFQPVILHKVAGDDLTPSCSQYLLDWYILPYFPNQNVLPWSTITRVPCFSNYERNPFYTFNTASAP